MSPLPGNLAIAHSAHSVGIKESPHDSDGLLNGGDEACGNARTMKTDSR